MASLLVLFQSPYLIGLLFLTILLITSMMVASLESFLGLVVFIIYVGGAMVLFSYCFMLTPLQETLLKIPMYSLPLLFLVGMSTHLSMSLMYEFYWISSMLFMIGIMLFLVMVSVVEMIDFGRGTMRVE
uniref:NADH dehydrogenase subunit 6 n=1 Tax=Parasagitta setosa TaxID=366441 RepID=A0A141CKP1_9BILA|nr:NADH dehydrogenase subunit 6 [Parasagitta setosa]AKS04076.1 NADH dehydrogenase subunit 6 [Parasagitta setosa]AKS04087.1 NADH dehydrogenase subunit 6 [Parasagitta setosa]AKS04098.1 NADH dehydrogenase subunit 6 [Parasagitta setosa]